MRAHYEILHVEILPSTLQYLTGPVQGQNREFPVYSFSQGKTCFHYKEPLFPLQVTPVLIAGTLYSLQGPCIHYRDPVFITGTLYSLQGIPCEKEYTGKSL